jgi:SAM-dependent methyltransferase
MTKDCPCCSQTGAPLFTSVSGYDYFQCRSCNSLFIDPVYLSKIDNGFNIVKYEEGYWKMELEDARDRSFGPALARLAEAIYYCKRPVRKFLDIGSGPGYLLDAVEKLLPDHAALFYGVELFPPDEAHRTKSKNYIVGDLGDLKDKFDCGICVEVVEHLTPTMLDGIFKKLASVSNPEALYIFNTGLPEYVINEDRGYLDPTKRGHIVSYSIKAISIIAGRHGFVTHPIKGKTWAYAVEFLPNAESTTSHEDIRDRIWYASKENIGILCDSTMGNVLKVLGLETARAYN